MSSIRMSLSSSSATVAACKTERDLSAMMRVSTGGKETLSGSFQLGITRKHSETSSNSPLKVSKESRRIRKPPLPLPQVQYRPPIIVHTHSPKVIHTQPHDFMSLVQKLTGSSDTRVRLKKSLGSSKKDMLPCFSANQESIGGAGQSVDSTLLERQGSGGSSSATVNNCGSPTSSEDSTFLVTEIQEVPAGIKQSNSPRSPLDSSFEFDNVTKSLFSQTFSHFAEPSVAGSTMFNLQVKAEPMFAFHDSNPFDYLADFMQNPGLLLQASSKPAPKPVARPQMHQQCHQDLMSPNIESMDGPSQVLLSPNLMAGFSDQLAPQGWSQSNYLDSLNGASPAGSHFVNQGPCLRQRSFSGSYTLSPEGSTMVSLENIHAFMFQT